MMQSLADKPPVPASPAAQKRILTPFGSSVERETPAALATRSPFSSTALPERRSRQSSRPCRSRRSSPRRSRPWAALPPEQSWRLVGEVMQTYLVIDEGDGMLLIDKHAAHERILFEKLRAQQGPMMRQTLLEPLEANLSAEEAEAVLGQRELLRQFGYELDDEARLLQIPSELDAAEAIQGLQALAAQLLSGQRPDSSAMRDTVLHTIACKAAIKAGDITGMAELEALAREVLSREDIKYCPHGRPVCIWLPRATIERQFGRA